MRPAQSASGATRRSPSRRLGVPRPAAVRAGPSDAPLGLDHARVEAVAEEWVVEDQWWSGAPLRRRYFELVLADGRNAVVFCDLETREWFSQPG